MAVAFSNRSLAYTKKREYDLAIADATEAIRLDPTLEDPFMYRAIAYHNGKHEYDLAIADASEAIRLNPKRDNAFVIRAVAHYRKAEYDLAIADAAEAIRLDPNNRTAKEYLEFARKQKAKPR